MDDSQSLPSPKATKAAVIQSIRDCTIGSTRDATVSASSNPLLGADDLAKNCFLTLHALFPHELLPALDVLDRNLVVRLVPKVVVEQGFDLRSSGATRSQHQNSFLDVDGTDTALIERLGNYSARTFYVRSAQQRNQNRSGASKFKTMPLELDRHYEVRLDAWTCSCPAFSFSAFPAHIEDVGRTQQSYDRQSGNVQPCAFGGLTVTEHTPVCKHLLACLLISEVKSFSHFVDDKEVSLEEYTAWAAGWGD